MRWFLGLPVVLLALAPMPAADDPGFKPMFNGRDLSGWVNVNCHPGTFVAKGDEVLDWREMTGRYPGARIKLLEGGDHALSDFDAHLEEVLAFLQLA